MPLSKISGLFCLTQYNMVIYSVWINEPSTLGHIIVLSHRSGLIGCTASFVNSCCCMAQGKTKPVSYLCSVPATEQDRLAHPASAVVSMRTVRFPLFEASWKFLLACPYLSARFLFACSQFSSFSSVGKEQHFSPHCRCSNLCYGYSCVPAFSFNGSFSIVHNSKVFS